MALTQDRLQDLESLEKEDVPGGLGMLASLDRGFGGEPTAAERRRIEALKAKLRTKKGN